jgi:diguanylate cyclase (GGDEF)-like protein
MRRFTASFANLRIATKLSIASLVALLALGALAMSASIILMHLKSDLDALHLMATKVQAAARLQAALGRAQVSLYETVAYAAESNDREGLKKHIAQARVTLAEVSVAKEAFERQHHGPSTERLGTFFAPWKENTDKVLGQLGDAPSTLAFMEPAMGPASISYANMTADLERLVADTDAARNATFASARGRIARSGLEFIGFVLAMGVVLTAVNATLGRAVARPILSLAKVMARLASGHLTTDVPGTARRDEIGRMARGVEFFKHSVAEIDYLARHDSLTGLANRSTFAADLKQATIALRSYRKRFNLLLLDLDKFKDVNDSLGHPAGDALLQAVASRIAALTEATDIVARLGGDEFAILQSVTGEAQLAAEELADAILHALDEPFVIDGQELAIGISIGIAIAADPIDAETLQKRADLALHQAKSRGRNCYRVFEASMAMQPESKFGLEHELQRAVQNDEFELHYQPIIKADSLQVTSMEALLRWRHPKRGLLAPGSFIPALEKSGLILPLGDIILKRACADAAQWPADIKVAINISPRQCQRDDFEAVVRNALTLSGLPPDRLELEFTETALLDADARTAQTMASLRALGCSIVLDDFGTGYSSLTHLQRLPIDKLKIDRSFVNKMALHTESAAIVAAVIGLARTMDIATTAEGIETREQAAMLRAAGVNEFQGYLFSRPLELGGIDFDALSFDEAAGRPAAASLPARVA